MLALQLALHLVRRRLHAVATNAHCIRPARPAPCSIPIPLLLCSQLHLKLQLHLL